MKNGAIVSCSDSIRVKKGAQVVSGMQINATQGNCVALYDTNVTYKDINRIENSILLSAGGACLSDSEASGDFSITGITLNSVDMVSSNPDGARVITMMGGDTLSGQTDFEDKVRLYAYGTTACPNGMVFTGNLATKETGAAAVVGERSCTDMTLWTTESENDVDMIPLGDAWQLGRKTLAIPCTALIWRMTEMWVAAVSECLCLAGSGAG